MPGVKGTSFQTQSNPPLSFFVCGLWAELNWTVLHCTGTVHLVVCSTELPQAKHTSSLSLFVKPDVYLNCAICEDDVTLLSWESFLNCLFLVILFLSESLVKVIENTQLIF